MKRLIPILLIFLTFSIMQFGQQAKTGTKPKIGLLTFSVNAFDEESKKINASINAVKKIIHKELKKRFQIVKETSDEITYSDIELPEVTIDPVVEPETNKKLEKLCEKDWDGLVFGHFHQEDKLVVVTRFYLSKKKYPGLKKDERIISSPEKEIPTKNLDKESLEKLTAQSIRKLIEAVKMKKPGIFGLVKKKSASAPDNKGSKEQKKLPEKTEFRREKKTETDTSRKGEDKEGTNVYEIETLNAKDVYQMIVDNGFYCEIVNGSQFHEDGLKDIKERPKNSIFPLKRAIDAQREGDDFIRTISIKNFESPKGEKKIELLWYTQSLQYCSYKKAIEIIDNLNNKKTKIRKWRIPTVMELLSITRHDTKDHFPYIFKFHKYFKKKDLVFWTSTSFNGTHCVIKSRYDSSKKLYWLHFSFMNIKKKNIALILPVYSPKVYTYRPNKSAQVEQIPGFDDVKLTPSKPGYNLPNKKNRAAKSPLDTDEEDKIPGFDDVSNNKPLGLDEKDVLSDNRTFKITLIPYFCKRELGSLKENELNDINFEIEKALKHLNKKVKAQLNCNLIIDNKDTNYSDNISEITNFYIIFSDKRYLRMTKAGQVMRDIMKPQNIDVVVTVRSKYIGGKVTSLEPVIINGIDNTVSSKKFIQNRSLYKLLIEYVLEKIEKSLYGHFRIELNSNGGY